MWKIRSNLGTGVVVFAATLTAGLLAGEAALRLMLPNRYVNETMYIQRMGMRSPNMDYVLSRRTVDSIDPNVRLRTDARAYYLPSRRFDDPEKTIVFMGGSTTECSSVREDLRFPVLVSHLLEEKGRRINTMNIGHSANSIHDVLNVLLNHVVADRPDYVVLMTGGIDSGLDGGSAYEAEMARPLTFPDILTWLKRRMSSASWLVSWTRYTIAYSRSMGVHGPDSGMDNRSPTRRIFPAEEFRRRVRAFVALARTFEIEPILVPEPYARFKKSASPQSAVNAQDRAAEIVREVGRSDGVVVIDLPTYLRESVPGYDKPMHVFYDGSHITDDGSRIYARYIAEQFYERVLSAPPLAQSGRADRIGRSSGAALGAQPIQIR